MKIWFRIHAVGVFRQVNGCLKWTLQRAGKTLGVSATFDLTAHPESGLQWMHEKKKGEHIWRN